MADDDIAGSDGTPPDLDALSKAHVAEMFSIGNLSRLEQVIANAIQAAIANAIGAILASAGGVGALVAKSIELGEQVAAPVLAPLMATMIQSAFGIEVDERSLSRIKDATARGDLGRAMGATVLGALHTEGGETQPSQEPAEKLIGMLAHLAMDSWAEGTIVEWIISLSGMLHELEGLTKLAPAVVQATGLDELGRIALRPLATITVGTPLTWAANKQYRPNLLGAGEIARAFIAGDYSAAEAKEELSRLGFSDRRQDIIVKNALKVMSIADSLVLVRDGHSDRQLALDNARLAGYDAPGAEAAVLVEEVKHLNAIRDDSAAAIKAAYVDRRISDSELDTYLPAVFYSDEDRDGYKTAWRTIRDLNTKRLSPGEAKAAVVAGVLPIAGYRDALRRDGYDEESVLVLELLLETELDEKADVEKLREQKIAEAAAAKKAAADAAAAKAAAVEQQRALARRGSLSDLARAVVRGLIPVSRYAEVLAPQYDSDTVDTLVGLVEQDRAAYVAQQAKAADAAKRAAVRHVDVGALQAAYLDNVLTLDQVRQQLVSLAFDAPDVDILTATMQARKADLDAAKAQREKAAAAAKVKSIDLSRFEALVRRGHRTIGEYSNLLASLGFDEGARAAMIELLQLQIADDTAARQLRDAAKTQPAPQGLTLDQIRRAVLLGVKSFDDFERYLRDNKFTLDAQTVLVAELRDDVAQAETARAKRDAAAGATVETRAPLSTIARAARLGIISPDVYAQRLQDAGYSDDDIAIEMDLLAVEIADVQAQRARSAAAEAKTTDRGLSLDQLAKAVKLGAASVDDYRARAVALGYTADDVETLVAVLTDELQAVQDAEARHTAIAGQLTARNLSLSELDDAVKQGLMTLDAYNARVRSYGFGTDDADLLTTLLALKLPAPPAAGEP